VRVGSSPSLECPASVGSTKPKRQFFCQRRWTTKKNKNKKGKLTKGKSKVKKLNGKNRRALLMLLSQERALNCSKWSGWSWLGEPFVTKVFLNVSRLFKMTFLALGWYNPASDSNTDDGFSFIAD